MKLKSPTEPIILTDKSYNWLEKKLANNESRNSMNKFEKELFEGAQELIKTQKV